MLRREFIILAGTLAVSCLTWGCGESSSTFGSVANLQSEQTPFGRWATDQFFAEDSLGRIYEINPNRGLVRVVDQSGTELSLFTGAQRPYAVAFGPDGDSYLLDRGSGGILVLNSQLQLDRQFGQGLQGGTKILFCGDEVLVLRANAGKLLAFTRAGDLLRSIDLRKASGLVTSLALHPNGDLHLVRRNPLSIEVVSARTGESRLTYGQGLASAIRDISIDSGGRIALLDHIARKVLIVDPLGQLVGSFSPPGSPGALVQPISAGFSPSGVLHIHTREIQANV